MLGNYANTAVTYGASATVTPSAVPTGATSLTVIASSGFQGVLSANPATGVVRITNPASGYLHRDGHGIWQRHGDKDLYAYGQESGQLCEPDFHGRRTSAKRRK